MKVAGQNGFFTGRGTMSLPTQTIGGLISGMDTNNIISQLMDIERTSVTRLENKKAEFDLQLEAYRSVNNLLLEYSSAASNLANVEIWNSKNSVSSDESTLSATAQDTAVEGTHTFKVARTATNAKFMSQGFADMDDAIAPYGIDKIMVDQAFSMSADIQGFLDYNGITDALGDIVITNNDTGQSATVNLASCNTFAQVQSQIFMALDSGYGGTDIGVNIATAREDADTGLFNMLFSNTADSSLPANITISSPAGDNTASNIGLDSITNIGQESLYTVYQWKPGDLPQVEETVPGTISIENAKGRATRDTEVKALNGGTGIYHGSMRFTNASGTTTTVDVSGCETVGDILNKVNSTEGIGIELSLGDDGFNIRDTSGGAGTLKVENVGLGETATDLGLTTLTDIGGGYFSGGNINQLNENSALGLLRDGRGINNGTAGNIMIFKNGIDYTVDLANAHDLGDIVDAINNAESDDGDNIYGLKARIEDNRLVIEATDGNAFNIRSDTSGDGLNSTAEDLGIACSEDSTIVAGKKLIGDINSVQIDSLMGQKTFSRDSSVTDFGLSAGDTFTVTDKLGKSVTYTAKDGDTLGDVIDKLNDTGDSAQVVAYLDVDSGKIIVGDTTEAERWVYEDTPLSEILNGTNIAGDKIQIATGDGTLTEVDLSGVITIGDVLDAINNSGALVTAGISADGKGISIVDTSGGPGTLGIDNSTGYDAADLLGIAGSDEDGVIKGSDLERFAPLVSGNMTVSGTAALNLGFDADNSETEPDSNGLKGNQIYNKGINGVQERDERDANGILTANLGAVTVTVDGADYDLDLSDIHADDSMNDLLEKLNSEASANGLDITFKLNNAQNGIKIVNNTGFEISFKNSGTNTTASDLGLTNDTISDGKSMNAGDLDTQWVTRSLKLTELNGGSPFNGGSIRVTNSLGGSSEVMLTGAETMGDVIDAINNASVGVTASINATGDGIRLTDDSGGEGNITVGEVDGGSVAEMLGLKGSGKGQIDGSFEKSIEVDENDSLRDVMNKIAYSGLDVQCSVINDGSDFAPYRLVITSRNTGQVGDILLDTDISAFNFEKTSTGRDSVLLYGQGEGGVSPVMMTSSTNENNTAVLGLSLDMHKTSDSWVTVSVEQEKSQASDAIQALVDAYNTIMDLVDEFDDYDSDEGKGGVFFADANIRNLINSLSDSFFTVTETDSGGMTMWYDLGVKFNDEGRLEVDTTTLNEKISSSYDMLKDLIVKSIDVAKSDMDASVSTTDKGKTDPNNAINGNNDSKEFDEANGFESSGTIPEGGYEYTINFDIVRTLDRLSIYHVNTSDMPAEDYALEDFIVQYLDPSTNKWTDLRTVTNNTAAANHMGFATPTAVKGIKIIATSTNADDNKFRLAEVEAFEPQGLGAQQESAISQLTDSISGWFANLQESLQGQMDDIDESIEDMEERLDDKEARLIQQYTNMELALSDIQSQGDYFSQQAASWSGS